MSHRQLVQGAFHRHKLVVRRTTLSDATAAPTQAAEACADPPYLGEITQCYARAEVWRSRVVAVSYQQRA